MVANSFLCLHAGYFSMVCSRHASATDYHGPVDDCGYLHYAQVSICWAGWLSVIAGVIRANMICVILACQLPLFVLFFSVWRVGHMLSPMLSNSIMIEAKTMDLKVSVTAFACEVLLPRQTSWTYRRPRPLVLLKLARGPCSKQVKNSDQSKTKTRKIKAHIKVR